MAIKEQLTRLANETNQPCVTISLNTHRTHPDNLKDEITLKNYIKDAENRVIEEFGKRPAAGVLEKLEEISKEISRDHNLDSLHIFISNDTKEIVRSSWETTNEGVHISETFAIKPLIKEFNRSESYLIAVLSQGGVNLYEALNGDIVEEIKNDDFPFDQTPHYVTHADRASDSKHVDDQVREYLNKVDKAIVRAHNENDLHVIVICTETNYARLQEVADKPSIYIGYAAIDYNNVAQHQIAEQAWEMVKQKQFDRRTVAIENMKEAVATGNVLTDLQEIFEASIDGRAETLIVHQDFRQAVIMKDDRTIERVDDPTMEGAIDDITSNIAWEVVSKKGKVYFTSQDEIKDLGASIVLKTRY